MILGTCELCHLTRDLHDSHYLPRGGYKRARAPNLKNPNPIVLSNGKAQQTSLQVSDYKFCTECEQRLSNGGEAWVLSKVPAEYGQKFEIHTLLDTATPVVVRNGFLLFPAAKIPGIDLTKLVYFGMSIFWRGTLDWSPVNGGRPPKLFMNIRQTKAVRQFLLGNGPLPGDMVLTVAVWPFKKVGPMNFVPTQLSGGSYRRYRFYFSGFIFILSFGKKLPAEVKRTCAYRAMVLTVSLKIGESVKQDLLDELNAADKTKIQGTLQEIAAISSTTSSNE
jgi:hypothetical protein